MMDFDLRISSIHPIGRYELLKEAHIIKLSPEGKSGTCHSMKTESLQYMPVWTKVTWIEVFRVL